MSEHYYPIRYAELAKRIVFQPIDVLEKVKEDIWTKESLAIFCIGAFISFLKSFSIENHLFNFYASEWQNNLFSILSNPQLKWAVCYAAYFGFIAFVFIICKFFNRQANFRNLLISLALLSTIGVLAQVLFFAIKFIVPKSTLIIGSYIVYLWVIWLSVKAISISQSISTPKALISFMVPAIIVINIMGLPAITPYLAWLTI